MLRDCADLERCVQEWRGLCHQCGNDLAWRGKRKGPGRSRGPDLCPLARGYRRSPNSCSSIMNRLMKSR
jgi:hypothetical protein